MSDLPDWLERQSRLRNEVSNLRYEAYLAFLDGRNARAKTLNRRADKLDRQARDCKP